jgi:hypothetical protein
LHAIAQLARLMSVVHRETEETAMRISWLAALVVGAAMAGGQAMAQTTTEPATAPPIGSTVTGAPADRTGSLTAVGQTKPSGAAVGDDLGTRPDLQEKSRKLDQQINQGICSGCK